MSSATDPTPVVPADHRLPDPAHAQAHAGGDHPGGDEHAVPTDLPIPSAGVVTAMVVGFAAVLLALFFVGWFPAHREEREVYDAAAVRARAKPKVQWAKPVSFPGTTDVHLPCDLRAYQETALIPRTSGYLKEWDRDKHDIGAHVKKGELLAVIDTPEVDAQLEQSRATLNQNQANVAKAQADLDLANSTLRRYIDSQRASPGSVTQEDIDKSKSSQESAEAALKQVQATVKASQADVDRLVALVGFERIVAPFDGVITKRTYDLRALLTAGDTAVGHEMFDVQQTDKLRVFVNVPQVYANNVKMQQEAKLFVRNFPDVPFLGRVTYTAGAIDPVTRTLAVQIDFDNKDERLFAGAYGDVHLPVAPQKGVMVVKTSALVFNAERLHVGVLDEQGKVRFKAITVGRDFGTEIEVTGGLDPDDKVIVNPGERISEGAVVESKPAPADKAPATRPTTQPAIANPTTVPTNG